MLALNRPEAGRTIHGLFEEQAARTPDAVALVFEGERLTYRELDRRADEIAIRLQELGVGPDVLAALYVERSLEMVVGLLAVLKAGGAYVPIDASYPPQRVAAMLADAAPACVLTQARLASFLPEGAPPAVTLDAIDPKVPAAAKPAPSQAGPENLAYVIYTSGSTGQPKGVCIEHRNIVSYVRGVVERFRFSAGMSHAMVSTVAADLGNTVLFPSLVTGGCLHVISKERAESGSLLGDYFARERIDVLKIVPSHLAALQTGKSPERLMPRMRLVLGGEASRLDMVGRLRAFAPECEIFNHYGPTETTVGALTYAVRGELPQTATGTLPLGTPLPNSRVAVLDAEGRPTARGDMGELFIGGEGVARGYLRRPELTAERFVADRTSAASGEPGARMYKTGDLVRALPGGDLEFCGRADDQVKIRGYRVELGEVEQALRAHPGVREAVVLAREDGSGDRQLAAYVVPRRGAQPFWGKKNLRFLPDGSPVAHLNTNETDYIYQEIFVLQAYLRHGIEVHDGDCIVDAGANVGLFTVFANRLAAGLRMVSIEPNPAAFECLSANAAAYGDGVKCLPCGLASEEGSAPMTVFPGMSLLSGFHADAVEEGRVVTRYALAHASGSLDGSEAELERLVASRMRMRTESVSLKTLSSVIAAEGLERIDLLKVNVEKSELDVLRGIADADWPRIRQAVVEVDLEENVAPVLALFSERGFEVLVEQDPLLSGTELRYVYAIRPSTSGPRLVAEQAPDAHLVGLTRGADGLLTSSGLRRFLKERLPLHMMPAGFAVLPELPRNANGKVDRQALALVPAADAPGGPELTRPRNETEKTLAAIWCELLKLDRVGVEDDFFDLGGHSLLAMKAVSRIRDAFGVDVEAHTLFEAPTIAGLAAVLREAGTGEAAPIRPRAHGGPVPLSFAQEPIWFLDRLAPGSPAYNIVDVVPLRGSWDAGAMRLALRELVRRHEVLRTRIADGAGGATQIVVPALELSLGEADLSALPASERERERARVVREEARRPFVLSEAPLLRATALHLDLAAHELLLVVHHLVADEWSMEVIQQEVAELYEAFSEGREHRLAPLPVQYADFASWQRERLRGEVLEREIAWWREELEGAPTVLDLATDRPRPEVQTFRGATEGFAIPGSLLARVKSLARQEQATVFMLLHSAFLALLHRYTGRSDVLVGTPITGRTRSETERMVGCFINTVVMRGRFPEGLTGRALVRQVRERSMGAYAHAELPLRQVVAALSPERDPSRTPLFQVMFVMHDADGISQVSRVSGNRALATGTSKLDLTLFLAEEGDGLEGMVEYAADLFDAGTIRRFCRHYATLLEALVADPDRTVATLPMLTDEERAAIARWNATEAVVPEKRVDELIALQAARTPERIAVALDRTVLTYAELERSAERIAARLRARGVAPGVRVGIFMERSPEMLAALLGVWKAGGAYVPLDPGFPAERLAYMLENSGAAVVVTHGAVTGAAASRNVPVLCVDEEDAETLAAGAEGTPARPDDLAYVLYTSGSTGRPKGVAVTHRSLVNLLESMGSEPGLTEADVLLSVTTLSFDIAALELYLPLMKGARVVLAARDDVQDGRRLAELLASSGATVMQATPTTWRMLVESGWEGTPGLKVLCGGEALPRDLADELLARSREVWNLYGPTETTVWSSSHRVEPGRGTVPIGSPIANTQLRVLDAHLQPLPAGVPGELAIGGLGVAQGYWGQPERTAERFVPDPYSPAARARLYLTGDLARWLPDGRIECLGRMDTQVKVRGFRIELGEIETRLRDLTAVGDAVVLAEGGPGAERRLVAYVARGTGEQAGAPELRAHLAASLPAYMVPAAFVFLDALPRTPNGKVDRKALAAFRGEEAERPPEGTAPRTPTEEAVASIWTEVLGVRAFGVHDDLFACGGHSLTALRIVARVRSVFGVDLGLRRLFQGPTIAELSEAIDGLASASGARRKAPSAPASAVRTNPPAEAGTSAAAMSGA